MALTPAQQILELVRRSSHVLVTFPPDGGVDAAAAALMLGRTLRAEGKTTDIVAAAFDASRYAFLPGAPEVRSALPSLQKLVVEINTREQPIEEVSYEVKEGALRVYITPKEGHIAKETVRLKTSPWRYDLIVVVGSADLESLRTVYTAHKDLFVNVPILNIDCSPANEQFGQVNVVHLHACSAAEVALQVREAVGLRDLDEDEATLLLAGIIAATKNFKIPRVTHKTLETAARLIAAGARREEIVTHMQRTRTLESLKLWGEVFSTLHYDAGMRLAWTALARDVFIRTGASEETLQGIASEILLHSPEADIVMLVFERIHGGDVRALVAANEPHNARELVAPFAPEGTAERAYVTGKEKGITAFEQELIAHLKTVLESKKR